MGDGVLPDFNGLEEQIKEILDQGFDLIDLEAPYRKGYLNQDADYSINKLYKIDDYLKYCKKYFSHLTYWGASIVSKDFFEYAFTSEIIQKYRLKDSLTWWLPYCLLECMCEKAKHNQCPSLYVIYSSYLRGNRMKKDLGWKRGENYFIVTFKNLQDELDLLPSEFNPIKEEMIRFFRDDYLVSDNLLITLRIHNTLNTKNVEKYKSYITYLPGYYEKMIALCKKSRLSLAIPKLNKRIANKIKRLFK